MVRYALFVALIAATAYLSYDLGRWGARAYERMQVQRVESGLEVLGIRWAQIEADGLMLELHGHAPDMFARDLALESAAAMAPLARIGNFATATLAPPERRDNVRIELHRNASGITMTGQTASRDMRDRLNATLRRDAPVAELRNLTGIQAATPPNGWGPEIDIASRAAGALPNAYVVIRPGRVMIKGNVDDAATRDALTERLVTLAGTNVALDMEIGIPPKVIVPFAFAAWKELGGTIIPEICAARSPEDAAQIARLLSEHSTARHITPCAVGLGGPPGDWPAAIAAAVTVLEQLPAGRVDVEYRHIRLIAAPPTPPADFEQVAAAFQYVVPEGFTAEARLDSQDVATLSSIGRERYWMRIERTADGVSVRGEVPDNAAAVTVSTYAAALFGLSTVETELRDVGRAAPAGWTTAALRMLDALAETNGGAAEMAGYRVSLHLNARDPVAAERLHAALEVALPDYAVHTVTTIDVPAASASVPKPAPACAAALARVVQATPIDFAPGSAVISDASLAALDQLAEVFGGCTGDRIEIGGHTDSQGSQDLNQRLSLARAQAVVTGLTNRGVPLHWMSARGYGETLPIADNTTDAGRARNRRIEFQPAEG
ncbi:MAG: OmpA family protein [Pseudomonadota bacterium]